MMNKYRKTNDTLDMISGSLIGGAAGDALGYAIEFDRERTIFHEYGKQGITEYELDGRLGFNCFPFRVKMVIR